MNKGIDIVKFLLQIQNQLKICHWQTTSYGQHVAFGSAYNELDNLIDTFIESYMAKYGKIVFNSECSIQITDYIESRINIFLDSAIDSLNNLTTILSDDDTDLLNIRDEMVLLINKLKYLIMLK